ncbi:MAG: hypothetical protein JSU66_05625, partial [Deltaproteobacteria bacterium]
MRDHLPLRAACAVLLLVGSGACLDPEDVLAPERDIVVPVRRPEAAYERLFPYYVELCAVTQIRPLGKPPGGSPGHAVMYVKGACQDPAAPFPTLVLCPGNVTDAAKPSHGAGISVNKAFKNVNWVATPGKRLFLHGNLEPSERLTQARFDAAVRDALERGVFRGVEIHRSDDAPALEMATFVARDSIGTDFALRYGRSVFCMRLPITRAMVGAVMDYLNELNREYATGEADYNWSGYSDNCAHTLHNALAAAGIWKPKGVGLIKIRQFFHMAVPANEFVDLAALALESPLDDFSGIYRNELQRQTFLEQGWLPMQPGAMLKTLPVHTENDLYDTRFRLLVLESPFRTGETKRAQRLLGDARHTELRANLGWFRSRYDAILAAPAGAPRAAAGGGEFER